MKLSWTSCMVLSIRCVENVMRTIDVRTLPWNDRYLPSVLISLILVCKKICDVDGEGETQVILRYLMLVVVQKGNAIHVNCLGSSQFWCGCALTQAHSEEESHDAQIYRNGH